MAYGSGDYLFELDSNWARYPSDWTWGFVSGLAVDSRDRVYAFDRGGPRPVMVFDSSGNPAGDWGQGKFRSAHGIYVDPEGSIFCTDNGNHTVSKFSPDGRLLLVLGTKDKPSDTGYAQEPGASMESAVKTIRRSAPPFNKPTNVVVSKSGDIYVSDGYGNARIHKFSAQGKLLLSWGEPGSGPGQFKIPHRAWLDRQGQVWVADRENSRIQIFTQDGKYVREWPCFRPTDIFIDPDDVVYVGEGKPRLGISLFTTAGELLARIAGNADVQAGEWGISPHSLAVDSKGNVYTGGQIKGAKPPHGTVLRFTRK
ncbi:MAG: hypothetical protein HYX90_08975 [Chloroflexi bacterium]|nr:hypothetical protein [Chloroflexota bacterium]